MGSNYIDKLIFGYVFSPRSLKLKYHNFWHQDFIKEVRPEVVSWLIDSPIDTFREAGVQALINWDVLDKEENKEILVKSVTRNFDVLEKSFGKEFLFHLIGGYKTSSGYMFLVQKSGSPFVDERASVVKGLAFYDYDSNPLEKLVKDKSIRVKRRAVCSLAENPMICNSKIIGLLKESVSSNDSCIRAFAAVALLRRGEKKYIRNILKEIEQSQEKLPIEFWHAVSIYGMDEMNGENQHVSQHLFEKTVQEFHSVNPEKSIRGKNQDRKPRK